MLANETTYEQNQLFATLDPKTRQIQINEGFNLIISDTVGFIQKLPTTLVAAFKSTLEEAKGADLLLHVVDASHPEYRSQYDTVNQLIKQLDMNQIPQSVIFNKRINVQVIWTYQFLNNLMYLFQVEMNQIKIK